MSLLQVFREMATQKSQFGQNSYAADEQACVFGSCQKHSVLQFGTQAKFCWSRDHNNRTAKNASSEPCYFFQMELEPVAG